VAGLHTLEDFGMRQMVRAWRRRARDRPSNVKVAAIVEHGGAAGKGADPQLRPLQIDQDADRPGVILSTWRIAVTSSRILSCGVWLMLMRNTSAPASNSREIISAVPEAGPSVATILVRRIRLISRDLAAIATATGGQASAASVCPASAGAAAALPRLSVSCTVQARCSPVSTSKKPVRSKPRARQSWCP